MNNLHNKSLGLFGENHAKAFLQEKGHKILETNYHTRSGEVDLITSIKDYIVFTEVKTRANYENGTPAEAVDERKQRRIINVAELFLADYPEHSARFDIIEIIAVKFHNEFEVKKINHIENAFWKKQEVYDY